MTDLMLLSEAQMRRIERDFPLSHGAPRVDDRRVMSGIEAFDRVLGVETVFDVSATPFFLRGSGYPEGSLFRWVVSDFGLLDAIESGIVKVPRLPTLDDRIAGELPLFRNVYARVEDKLPKKGRGKQKEGALNPQNLPALLASALKVLYDHYARTFAEWEKQPELGRPPVFIVVCNNTATFKLVHDWIAGYEIPGSGAGQAEGAGYRPSRLVPGKLKLFLNIDEHGRRAQPMRTLLIDSEQLDSGEALSDEFMAAAEGEIEQLKREMRRRGQDADKLAPETILREVMNTVGRPGKLGGEIRYVVSVSMLTEGWDANTVTHILGVRAFGTQLLCEQVVGRGLRRVSYEVDPETGRFPRRICRRARHPLHLRRLGQADGRQAASPHHAREVQAGSAGPGDTLAAHGRVSRGVPAPAVARSVHRRQRLPPDPDMIPTVTENEPLIGEGITLDLRRNAYQLRLRRWCSTWRAIR